MFKNRVKNILQLKLNRFICEVVFGIQIYYLVLKTKLVYYEFFSSSDSILTKQDFTVH